VADDIVTRLRSAGKCLDGHICSKCDREVRDDMGCKCVCHDYPWGDAADEIERLRAAGDELAEHLSNWAYSTEHALSEHRALETWEEARRG
jgi:hypothetical protein